MKTFLPKAGPVCKNITEQDSEPPENIYSSSRIGPETAQKSKTVIEPDPEPPADLSQL